MSASKPNKKGLVLGERQRIEGFTLIELLVVISIIAILSVIGITVFSGVQKGARDAKRKGDVDAFAKMIEIYKSQHDTYTPATSWPCVYNWGTSFDNTTYGVEGSSIVACNAPSLKTAFSSLFASGSVPRDPLCSTSPCSAWADYYLAVTGGTSFVLSAKLETPPSPTMSGCQSGYNYCIKNQQ